MTQNIQAYIPNSCPSWQAVTDTFSDCSCMTIVDRIARGWQVSLTLGGAVLSVAQAIALLVSGMVGWAICAAAVAGILVFAASYVAQHSLIEELQGTLNTSREQNTALQGEIIRVQNAAQNLEIRLGSLGEHDTRLAATIGRLEIVQGDSTTRLERIGIYYEQAFGQLRQLLDDPGRKAAVDSVCKAIEQARTTLADLEKRAVATQAKNEELLKQYDERSRQLQVITQTLDSTTQKLNASANQAGTLLVASAVQANQATTKLDRVADRLQGAAGEVLATHAPVNGSVAIDVA